MLRYTKRLELCTARLWEERRSRLTLNRPPGQRLTTAWINLLEIIL
jgi:hypothetical protein